ncbi:DMT family transporter [Alicyclobacillus dauci]|nr:EamA family transporter [Alicyclobacillus dauci]
MEQIESKLNFENRLQTSSSTVNKSTTVAGKRFEHFKGLSMVLLGAVLWGVSGTAAQVLFQRYGFNPGWLVMVRMSSAGVLLLAGISIRLGLTHIFEVWKYRRDSLKLILFGIVGLLGVQYSYFASIRYGNAATGTMLQYMGPIFITTYVTLRNRRMPSTMQIVAVLLALIGAFLLVTDGNLRAFTVSPLAVFWGMISALTLAFYSLYPQSLLHRYGSATITGWGMLIGGVAMGVINPPWQFSGHGSLGTWGLVSFVVLFGTLIAFYVYIASLKYISASEASVLSCGEPLSATIIAVAFLNLKMGLPAMLGGLCIIVTVTILARKGSSD